MWVRCLSLFSGLRIWHCHGCGVGHSLSSAPTLLWLWCRLAAAAPLQPLAWELPYAMGVALKSKKKKKPDPAEGITLEPEFPTAVQPTQSLAFPVLPL